MSQPLSFGQAAGLVARREFSQRLRDRSFTVSTLITVGMIAAFIFIPRVVDLGGDSFDVAIIGGDTALQDAMEQQAEVAEVELTFADHDDVADAEAAIIDGDLDAFVADGAVHVERSVETSLRIVLDNAYSQVEGANALIEAGLDPAEVTAALSGATLDTVTLDPDADERNTRALIAFIGSIVLFGQLIGYSMWVAMGVVEEKSSRVVEIMLSAIPARAFLAGKIIGIGALGLVQLVVVAVIGIGVGAAAGVIELTGAMLTPVLLSLGWFVLGYAVYASLAAAAAARVSRQEELQNVTTPLTMTAMLSYFASFFAFMQPDSRVVEVISMVPPFSALVMPIRMSRGDAAGWEVGVALLLMAALIAGLVMLAARIYEGAVLRMGSKISMREALSSGRSGRS